MRLVANLVLTVPAKPSIWEAKGRFEREQGALTEEFELPPREIAEATWRNPLDE